MNNLKYFKHFLILFISIIFITACGDDPVAPPEIDTKSVKIAIFSDPHLFDPVLTTNGEEFRKYLENDRKLLAESDAILQSTINSIINDKPDIVLVPGDLTKDGEKQNHERFANYLNQLKMAGIKVFVIPGNHDINNPNSKSFIGNSSVAIPTINPDEFKNIYSKFGYENAIDKDGSSLSYIVEPINGLWIFGIDACKYDNNVNNPTVAGAIKPNTLKWIENKLKEAKEKKKVVLAFMHHGAVEHFTGQTQFFSDYVIDNWRNVTSALADAGLKVVFTGHFHANDITLHRTSQNNVLYDIQTGSLVSYPNPYRIAELTTDKKLIIKTKRVESINYNLNGEPNFQTYSKNFLINGFQTITTNLIKSLYNLTTEQAASYNEQIYPLLINALIAHYEGDEQPMSETTTKINQLLTSSDSILKSFGIFLNSLWTDLLPADNNIIINMTSGEVVQ